MRLLSYPIIRHPALVLFLVFCLPAQALAAVLIECKQHLSDTAANQSASLPDAILHAESETDCHGADSNVTNNSDSNDKPAANPDANGCFHCSGACQNLKSPSIANTAHQTWFFDNSAFSRLSLNTAVGASSTPARPPCPMILS